MSGFGQRLIVLVVTILMSAFVVGRAVSLAEFPQHRHGGHYSARDASGAIGLPAALGFGDGAAPGRDALLRAEHGRLLFSSTFPSRTTLISNDYASFNPNAPGAVLSRSWLVTSGSLFSLHGAGWTGVPDSRVPNAGSTNGTGSAIFRALVRDRPFGSVAVSFDLLLRRFVSTRSNPVHPWDGVHLFLHYQSQRSLYVVTLNRRDGQDLVKKKRPGGPANGGTYYTLGSPVPYVPPLGRWQHVFVTISTSPGASAVTITAYLNDRRLLAVTDYGVGGPVLSRGLVGIRADNADFEFAHFQVRTLS